MPCVFVFALGLTMWLNFTRVGGEGFYTYWPVVLAGFIVVVLCMPLPILYHKSRKWLLVSLVSRAIYVFGDFF